MSWTSWLSRFARRPSPASPPSRRGSRFRPRLEELEDRCLLATLTVTTVADNAAAPPTGSLRAALMSANNGDVITFAPSLANQTILLQGATLPVAKNITITGSGVPNVSISGGGATSVFTVNMGVSAIIDSLTITRGAAAPPGPASTATGGGIANFGGLSVSNCTITNNVAFAGAAASGGGIFNSGNLVLVNDTIANNALAPGAFPAQDFGGGVANSGTLSATNCTIVNNNAGAGGNGGGIGIGPGAATTLFNTIVANNVATTGPDVSGTITIANNSLFSSAPTIASGAANQLNTNPLLDPAGPKNNGGLTPTIALLPGSPAIAAGNPAFVGNPPFSGPPFFDQRGPGFARVINNRVDIGAFELQVSASYFAIGSDAGVPTLVILYNSAGGVIGSFNPFAGTGFTGGVRVAIGDVTGDAIPDLVVGSGGGGIGVVLIYDGNSVLASPNTPRLLASFNPYSNVFTGGVFVAIGNLDGGATGEIITGADGGGGPQVNIYSAAQIKANSFSTPATAFFALPPTFTGGVRVATGDVNKDGRADLIATAGPGGGPQVSIYLGAATAGFIVGAGQAAPPASLAFFALGPGLAGFTGGIYVSSLDINSDGFADVVLGAGAGGGPAVSVFSGAQLFAAKQNLNPLGIFLGLSPASFTGGVRVGTTIGQISPTQNGPIILAAAGPGGGPQVAEFNALAFFNNPGVQPAPFTTFSIPPGNFTNGLFASVT